MVIQLVQAVAVLLLPVAMYTGTLSVELLLATIPLLALLNQFVYPAQSAALPQIVADEQLTRANSAFSFAHHGLDMLFDAFGGLLIALVGVTTLFILDSATFVVASILFVGVRIPNEESADEVTKIDWSGYFADMAEGVRCVRGSVLAELTFTIAVSNFGVGMTLAVLPSFAAIRAGPALYGGMLGALGVGTALGAALTPRLEGVRYGHIRIVGTASGCVLWLGAVYTPWPALAVVLFAVSWIPAGISNVMVSTLEQTVTPEQLLGRVASVTASAAALSLPAGALVGGVIGNTAGPVNTMAVGGLTLGFVSLYSALRPRLRSLPAVNNIDPTAFSVGE